MNAQTSRLDRDAVRELAAATQHSEQEVRRVLEDEWRTTEKEARVKIFVPVFAKRRALDRLKGASRGRV